MSDDISPTTDIIAALDAYAVDCRERAASNAVVLRARDEIVALREKLAYADADYESGMKRIRAEALEEAARVCEDFILQQRTPDSAQLRRSFAGSIRALKEKEGCPKPQQSLA